MKPFKNYIDEEIKFNTIMNRGPSIAKKRSRNGYDSLSNHEKNILKAYKEVLDQQKKDKNA